MNKTDNVLESCSELFYKILRLFVHLLNGFHHSFLMFLMLQYKCNFCKNGQEWTKSTFGPCFESTMNWNSCILFLKRHCTNTENVWIKKVVLIIASLIFQIYINTLKTLAPCNSVWYTSRFALEILFVMTTSTTSPNFIFNAIRIRKILEF
jgi:hypothetical protein